MAPPRRALVALLLCALGFLPALRALQPAPTRQAATAAYGALLTHSLNFWTVQRLGTLPPDNPYPWRNSVAEKDGADATIDLNGGFADGGSYIKCTFPLAHALAMLSWGALEFWDGYAAANQTGRLLSSVRWGTDWLLRASARDGQLAVQVGDVATEVRSWGPDTAIPTPRPTFLIGWGSGTDVVCETAAALFASSLLFRSRGADPAYADQLLSRGLALYAAAYNAPKWQLYQVAAPAAGGTYPSSYFEDEVVWATAWGAVAAGAAASPSASKVPPPGLNVTAPLPLEQLAPPVLGARALALFDGAAWGRKTEYAPPFWDNKIPQTYAMLHRFFNRTDRGEDWISPLYQGNSSTRQGIVTPGGMLFWRGASEFGSAEIAASSAFLSFVLARSMRERGRPYADAAESVGVFQIGYLVGNNPQGRIYVTGIGPTSPLRASHRLSSGVGNINCINSTLPNAYQVRGMLVAGPGFADNWTDTRQAYGGVNEPTLSTQAGFQSALAYLAAMPNSSNVPLMPVVDAQVQTAYPDPCSPGGTAPPPGPTAAANATDPGADLDKAAMSQSARNGIAVAIAVGAVAIAAGLLGFLLYRRRQRRAAAVGGSAAIGSYVFRRDRVRRTFSAATAENGYESAPSEDGTLVAGSVGARSREEAAASAATPSPSEAPTPVPPAALPPAPVVSVVLDPAESRRKSQRDAREAYLESLRAPTWSTSLGPPTAGGPSRLGPGRVRSGDSEGRRRRRRDGARGSAEMQQARPAQASNILGSIGFGALFGRRTADPEQAPPAAAGETPVYDVGVLEPDTTSRVENPSQVLSEMGPMPFGTVERPAEDPPEETPPVEDVLVDDVQIAEDVLEDVPVTSVHLERQPTSMSNDSKRTM